MFQDSERLQTALQSGCARCVWEVYADELSKWNAEKARLVSVAALSAPAVSHKSTGVPMHRELSTWTLYAGD